MGKSKKWKMWYVVDDFNLCKLCEERYGMIYAIYEQVTPVPPLHLHCRCYIDRVESISAGTATDNGINGADWYLKYLNKLPEYYISREIAENIGWKPKKKNLHIVAPGKMISGGRFYNDRAKLPEKTGRLWYEADINYSKGKRNDERIVYSNDGLIFITLDHYKTFKEIV